MHECRTGLESFKNKNITYAKDEKDAKPSEVKIYKLSEEELAIYKALPVPKGKKPIDLRIRIL